MRRRVGRPAERSHTHKKKAHTLEVGVTDLHFSPPLSPRRAADRAWAADQATRARARAQADAALLAGLTQQRERAAVVGEEGVDVAPAWAGVGASNLAPPPSTSPPAWAATAAAWAALPVERDPLDPALIPWPPPTPPGHLLQTVARGGSGSRASAHAQLSQRALRGAWQTVALLYHPDKLGARLGRAGKASPAGRAALARGAAVVMAAREERRAFMQQL